MTQIEIDALAANLGKQTTEQLEKGWKAHEEKTKALVNAAMKDGGITKEQFDSLETSGKAMKQEFQAVLTKQGVTLAELQTKLSSGTGAVKSIAEVMHESKAELQALYEGGSGVKQFMVSQKADGTVVMIPHSAVTKAAGPTGTVSGLGGVGGNASSITQSIDAASLLRLGGMAMINGAYRNTQWLFDLVNTVQAGWDNPLALWFEETAQQGSAAVVAEGALKPLVQYAYTLKSSTYKKAAQLVTFTEEFSLDFARLQSDIMGKGRTDVLNIVQAGLLTDLNSAATAYNTGTNFKPGTNVVAPATVNDYDAIAAMAAQADNATYGAYTNTAIMSTFKKYRMGITKSTQGEYLNRPDVLDNIAFIGNPSLADDAVIVGDLKQMNLILRGGFLVKVGYNGTDFAQNQFSVVMEQYYFDYIPTVRRTAIVKGPNFADVKTAISTGT